ncbi:MAG: alpha-galactosidase [Pseudomonadota bacterium]
MHVKNTHKSTTYFVHLRTDLVSLVIDCRTPQPSILYFGDAISPDVDIREIPILSTRQEAKCSLAEEVPIALTPTRGSGFTGNPGIQLMDAADLWAISPTLESVTQEDNNKVTLVSVDSIRRVSLKHELHLCPDTHVLSAMTTVTNNAEVPMSVLDLSTLTVPLPMQMDTIMSFEGRWSMEFQTTRIDLFLGAYVRENRKGKTSHDTFPGVIVHASSAGENHGECYGFHLGWSGNHRTRVELLSEQRTYVQMGELLGHDEIQLAPKTSYTTPTMYISYSASGFNRMSSQFHRYIKQHILSDKIVSTPRPVHYNTWEGIYFDHDLDTLKQFADIMADVGTERYVLDDGWFRGRRSEKAGLGDWQVDETIYPNGLTPLIQHVIDKGMQFGIWFEPEMVNPDSDLYRTHPDWVLHCKGSNQLGFRHQYVLDLSREDVSENIYAQVADILHEYPQISYIKWDMNRDINHTGDIDGNNVIHAQTQAVYALIQRLKRAFPHVEIESCSSGGARIDLGILSFTDRFWTSDSNDALDRLSIQRGCSYFFPTLLTGSHAGPQDCHITGRKLSMEMRVGAALFGSMGMEMDPRELSEHDKECLKSGVAFFKEHRKLIHNGDYFRYDGNGDVIEFAIVDEDKSIGLFVHNIIKESRRTMPKMFKFIGLDPKASYTVQKVWPTTLKEYSRSILSDLDGRAFSAELLMKHGMQLPILTPQSCIVFKLTKQG